MFDTSRAETKGENLQYYTCMHIDYLLSSNYVYYTERTQTVKDKIILSIHNSIHLNPGPDKERTKTFSSLHKKKTLRSS